MSTKTTIKRIALVAVSALGLGVLTSVAPASAADNFNATFTAPSAYNTQTALVGGSNTVANVGTVTVNLATLNTALSTSADTATVTITSDGTTAGNNLLAALSLSKTVSGTTSSGIDLDNAAEGAYNANNNGNVTISGKTVTVKASAANFGTASGRAYLNIARASLASTDSGGVVYFDLTVSSAGVIQSYRSSLTLTIGAKAGTATTPVTTGTINAGGSATATYTAPFTNVPADATLSSSLTPAFVLTDTIASANGEPTFTVTGVATGGSVNLVRNSAGTTITPTVIKDALAGSLSVTYTITVNAPATAAAGETISVYGFTWTVQPTATVYSYSAIASADESAGTNGYYQSIAAGGDGFVWGKASVTASSSFTARVKQYSQTATEITAAAYRAPVTATITGVGSLAQVTSGANGAVIKAQSWNNTLGNLSGNLDVTVWSEGVSGEGTLTIAVNGATLKTYKLRFYGDAASVSATLLRPIGNNSGAENGTAGGVSAGAVTNNLAAGTTATVAASAATAPAIAVKVLDGNGWVIPVSNAPVASISDRTVVASVAWKFTDSGISDPATLKYSAGTFVQHYTYTTNANTSGKTATVTFTHVNAAGTSLSSTPVTVTLGGAVVKSTLTLDESSYRPGQTATLTFAGFDASGNKAYDGQDLAAGGFTSSLDFGGADNSVNPNAWTTAEIVNGVKVRTTYAPVVPGTWSLEASTADGVTGSVTVTIEDPSAAAQDAANEATDAANAATDAANAAAEAADAATAAAQDAQAAVAELATKVASLIAGIKAQITTLTNLVIKIQKKVRA